MKAPNLYIGGRTPVASGNDGDGPYSLWELAPRVRARVSRGRDESSGWDWHIEGEWLNETNGDHESKQDCIASLTDRLSQLASGALRWHLGFAERPLLWCVHVLGPDSVIPQPDMHTAEIRAGQWNKRLADMMAKRGRHEFDPQMACVVALWPWDEAGHAEGLAEHGGEPEDIC